MVECWRPVRDFPDYEVSDHGNVRSWKPPSGRGRVSMPRTLKLSAFVDKPYLRVSLYVDGKSKLRRVHHLVLEAFDRPRPPETQGCHNDGIATNNHISNLRWGTVQSNADDRESHGTQVRGESVTNSALTNEQAKEIRERVRAGEWRRGDGVKYAKKFGVGNSAISAVKNNLTWSHV